ncbi:MAG: tetratricopeptide repeat protein [bacterium]|nr:tetratricopeptide repeat protein [bacterium]MDD5354512.1 tetratricopeptide repeat protein [bacterium]MDD5756534.1 tetratricopeptide repeat protein [bacterium]
MITQIKKKITQIILLLTLLLISGCQPGQIPQDQLLVEDAEEWINAQGYDKALERLQKAIALNPRNVKAYMLLGDVYYFQSNVIMFRMQVLNLVFKYGRRLRYATAKELDLATPTEELLLSGMNSYQKALDLLKRGLADPTVEDTYLNYELGWGYMAMDDIANAKKYFQGSIKGGKDRWDVKSADRYIWYLEQKAIDQKNQEILEKAKKDLQEKRNKQNKK